MSSTFPARLERFASVESTQSVVRAWLDAGVPDVAVAVADEQRAGRGRLDRTWTAPPGAALLCSIGFRPTGLVARHAWRLGAIVALAMLDAAEGVAGLSAGRLQLKWPNDLVAARHDGDLRKVAGVLGESVFGADGSLDSAVIGIGVNADWSAADFPLELEASMTSLHELSGGLAIDREALLGSFLTGLEPRYEALLDERFDAGAWSARQVTTGREVEVANGSSVLVGRAHGVDPESGALRLLVDGRDLAVDAGDVTRCRIIP